MADVELDVTFEDSNENLDVELSTVYVIDGNTAVKVIANKYSSENTYAVDDYVIHESLLYRCITAIEEPEEFDSEKWFNIKLADDVKSLKTDKMDKNNPRGDGTIAVGLIASAGGTNSSAFGRGVSANGSYQHVVGKFNKIDNDNKYLEIVGNGNSVVSRSNARTLDKNGNETLAGDLTINGSVSVSDTFASKMDKDNPTGTGSLSLNRKSDTTVGSKSATVGNQNTASGTHSFAEGSFTTASEEDAHSEGYNTVASGFASHASGNHTTASGSNSHTEGNGTLANHRSQHVFGEYNTPDDSTALAVNKGNYVEIVGNGTGADNRSNARTLDWQGNETLAGDVIINGNQSVSGEISRLDGKIDNLPNPMIFKGTLGENGTITSLPNASASNAGHTYKVITEGTYAGQEAKVGDTFTSAKPVGASEYSWILFSEGDTDTDTWRAIKVNGTEKLSSGISSGAVDFVDTDNIEVTFDTTGNKVKIATKNIYTQTQVDTAVANKANKNNPVITGSLAMNKSSAYSLGSYATTLGYMGRASGYASTSIGMGNQAVGSYSTAIGYGSTSAGIASTAIGDHVDAKNRAQLVFGQFNIADPSTESGSSRGTYVEIVGNGTGFDFETGQENHSNARTLDWRGNEWLAGDLTINGNVSLANKINTYDSIIGNSLSATLTAGQTSVTIQDASITAGSILSVFTDVYGLQPLSVSATTGSVTLTFTAQGVDIHIKVEVK